MPSLSQNSKYWLERKDNSSRYDYRRRISKNENNREDLIRDWFGFDFAQGEIENRLPRAIKIKEIMPDVIEGIGLKNELTYDIILENWGTIAGDLLKKRAMPVAVRDGCLYIEVSDQTTYFYLKREFSDKILDNVKKVVKKKINSINFSIKG